MESSFSILQTCGKNFLLFQQKKHLRKIF